MSVECLAATISYNPLPTPVSRNISKEGVGKSQPARGQDGPDLNRVFRIWQGHRTRELRAAGTACTRSAQDQASHHASTEWKAMMCPYLQLRSYQSLNASGVGRLSFLWGCDPWKIGHTLAGASCPWVFGQYKLESVDYQNNNKKKQKSRHEVRDGGEEGW